MIGEAQSVVVDDDHLAVHVSVSADLLAVRSSV